MILDCMIIDDEPLAHEILERYISKFPYLNLVEKCTDAFTALDFIYKNPVQLIFLDINMPEIDGITFLKSLKTPPVTIFTTAYREYALDGFELNIADFLLKPFAFDRFAQAMNKTRSLFDRIQLNNIAPEEKEKPDQNFVFVRSGFKMIQLLLDEVMYIEGMKDYLKIYTVNERIVIKETMKKMESLLPDHQFMRVHKSYIISRKFVKSILRDKIAIADIVVPVGRNYFELVTRRIKPDK
jgi:two-component system, LytTR family, response regulator